MTVERSYYENEQIESETYYKGKTANIHRLKKPAHREWYMNGQLRVESYMLNGILHKIDGPAETRWYPDGTKFKEQWYTNGMENRLDGPSSIQWYQNGIVQKEQWMQKGVKHRIDGPAIIEYSNTGQILFQRWYVFGNLIDPKEYPTINFKNWPLDQRSSVMFKLLVT